MCKPRAATAGLIDVSVVLELVATPRRAAVTLTTAALAVGLVVAGPLLLIAMAAVPVLSIATIVLLARAQQPVRVYRPAPVPARQAALPARRVLALPPAPAHLDAAIAFSSSWRTAVQSAPSGELLPGSARAGE